MNGASYIEFVAQMVVKLGVLLINGFFKLLQHLIAIGVDSAREHKRKNEFAAQAAKQQETAPKAVSASVLAVPIDYDPLADARRARTRYGVSVGDSF